MPSNASDIFKGHCQVFLVPCCRVAHVTTICWCCILEKKLFDTCQNFSEFPYWKGGWLMLGFTWSPQQLLHHYAKVKDPYEKRNSVSCYKSPIQNTCFLFWVLLPTFSVTFLKAHHLSLLQFPSHPFPYASCELFDDIVIQRNFKHLHCFSKTFFSVQTFSTSHTTYHPGKPRRNQEVVHCGRLCIRLHVAVDIPVLLQLDPKSTEVEELYFTSAQTSL